MFIFVSEKRHFWCECLPIGVSLKAKLNILYKNTASAYCYCLVNNKPVNINKFACNIAINSLSVFKVI